MNGSARFCSEVFASAHERFFNAVSGPTSIFVAGAVATCTYRLIPWKSDPTAYSILIRVITVIKESGHWYKTRICHR